MMPSIAIVYYSQAGHTQRMAGLVAQGANDAGATVALIQADRAISENLADLHDADAIIFGAPTFMGGVATPMKAFMDATSDFWADQPWANKISAGFTIGSRYSGDKLATLQTMSIFAAQHGMIWVGQGIVGKRGDPNVDRGENGDGAWLGLTATASPDKAEMIFAADAATARAFGARLATAAARWKDGTR